MNCKRQTRLENKDTKLTIRITESEVEEIDSFLKGNPRFSSRSEFIRFAALDYVAQNRIKILGPNEVSLSPALPMAINALSYLSDPYSFAILQILSFM